VSILSSTNQFESEVMLPHACSAPQALSDNGAYQTGEHRISPAADITAIISIDCKGGRGAGVRLMAHKSLLDIKFALNLG
jgi:hypothetical protein